MKKLLIIIGALFVLYGCKKDALPFVPGTVVKINSRITSIDELSQDGIVPKAPFTVVRSYQKYGEYAYWYILNDSNTPKLVIDIDGRDIER